MRKLLAACLAAVVALGVLGGPAVAKGKRAEARNMKLVGMHGLQARSAYQPVIEFNPLAGRWIAYVGHHAGSSFNRLTGEEENNGTSILDVTRPRRPRLLAHIPGKPGDPDAGGAQMARVCNGSDLPKGDPNKVYLLRAYNGETPELTGHEIWDVTRPRRPRLVTTVVSGLTDTHKNWWECDTGIAYLVSGVPGWRVDRMTQVFDLSDPENPVHIRDYGLVGQEPGSTGPIPTELHGPIRLGNRIYFGHGTDTDGIMQIVDREKLLNGDPAPTPENLLAPQVSRIDLCTFCGGAHTTFPVLGIPVKQMERFGRGQTRDVAVIVNESLADECMDEVHQMVYLADNIVDRVNTGMHILRAKGKLARIARR